MNASQARDAAVAANLKSTLPDIVEIIENAASQGLYSCVVSRELLGPKEIRLLAAAGYRCKQERFEVEGEGEELTGDFEVKWGGSFLG